MFLPAKLAIHIQLCTGRRQHFLLWYDAISFSSWNCLLHIYDSI